MKKAHIAKYNGQEGWFYMLAFTGSKKESFCGATVKEGLGPAAIDRMLKGHTKSRIEDVCSECLNNYKQFLEEE